MIHVQGQPGANWRRHADFTALSERGANPAHRPLNPFLASLITSGSTSPRARSPWSSPPCVVLPFRFSKVQTTQGLKVSRSSWLGESRWQVQEQLQVEGQMLHA